MRNKVKVVITLATIIAMMSLFGFGCKGMSTTEKQLTQPVTLEYWTVFDDVDALRVAVDKYRLARPYLTVNIRQLNVGEFYPRLIEALAEDKGPDIISIRNRTVKEFESKLSPMPPSVPDTTVTVTKTKLGTNTTVTTLARYLPTVGQLQSEYVKAVAQDAVRNGKIYGLPLSLDDMAVYYNKDLLDRSGIAEPPKTWEEFSAAVKKISRVDSRTGVITQSGAALGTGSNVPGVDDLLYVISRQDNVPFVASDGAPLFASSQYNAASGIAKILDFYTDFANPGRDTYSWNSELGNALDEFVNGKVGFLIGYSYHYNLIKARAPQLNLGILPLFQLDVNNPVNAANYWLDAVTLKSKHQNEAWALIDYLTHSPANKDYLATTGRPAALRSYLTVQKSNPALAPFVSQALVADNWYRGSNYDAALKAIDDLVDNWIKIPESDKINEYRQNLLNQTAAKISQTL